MEKSNLPLPLKRKPPLEATSSNEDSSTLEKRSTTQFRHTLRDSPGRSGTLRERSQFGGGYFKKRFGHSSKKSFTFKGSKAVVNTLCATGDLADACFPVKVAPKETASAGRHESSGRTRSLSMKTKLLQLQERNQLILAKQQTTRRTRDKSNAACFLTLATPLSLEIDKDDSPEEKPSEEQHEMVDLANISPIYHELDPKEGNSPPTEQHTYQSISEVREEVAKLEARDFWNTMSALKDTASTNNCQLLAFNTSWKKDTTTTEASPASQTETKSHRPKSRSIFSKFWMARRSQKLIHDDPNNEVERSSVYRTGSLANKEVTQPSADNVPISPLLGGETYSVNTNLASLSSVDFSSLQTSPSVYGTRSTGGSKGCYSTQSISLENSSNRPFHSPSFQSDQKYLYQSRNKTESEGKFGLVYQNKEIVLQNFAEYPIIPDVNKNPQGSGNYQHSMDLASLQTEWQNAKPLQNYTTVVYNRFAKGSVADSMNTSLLTTMQCDRIAKSSGLVQELYGAYEGKNQPSPCAWPASDLYLDVGHRPFLSRSSPNSPVVAGSVSARSLRFSSPSCGVRMAEMRAIRRKSEGGVHPDYISGSVASSRLTPGIEIFTDQNHVPETSSPSPQKSSSCTQTDLTCSGRNMQTILEEDQPCHAGPCCQLALVKQKESEYSGKSLNLSPNTRTNTAYVSAGETGSVVQNKMTEANTMISSDDKENSNNPVSLNKQCIEGKVYECKLKRPKPISIATHFSAQLKQPNDTLSDNSVTNSQASEQNIHLSDDTRTENMKTEKASLHHVSLAQNMKTADRATKQNEVKQAFVRQIETAVGDSTSVNPKLSSSLRSNSKTIQPKPGSYIPRTKRASIQRNSLADDRASNSQCETMQKSPGSAVEKKTMSQMSVDGKFDFGARSPNDNLESLQPTLRSSNAVTIGEIVCIAEESSLIQDMTDCLLVKCLPKTSSNESSEKAQIQSSTTSSLSSSVTSNCSSNSSGSSIFDVADSESESLSSSGARDLQTSTSTLETHASNTFHVKPYSHSSKRNVDLAGERKSLHKKSQLAVPRTDVTQCLERIERIRLAAKQTKHQFNQKLRH